MRKNNDFSLFFIASNYYPKKSSSGGAEWCSWSKAAVIKAAVIKAAVILARCAMPKPATALFRFMAHRTIKASLQRYASVAPET